MAPPPFFDPGTRAGVSELYASMLMIGVTLALGGIVVAAAMGSAGQANASASLGSALQEEGSGVRLSLVYAVVAPSGACPPYRGVDEGTSLTVALFDYGTEGFSPAEIGVNSTLYSGGFPTASPGAMAYYTVVLGTCAHASGLTVAAIDTRGEEVQVGT